MVCWWMFDGYEVDVWWMVGGCVGGGLEGLSLTLADFGLILRAWSEEVCWMFSGCLEGNWWLFGWSLADVLWMSDGSFVWHSEVWMICGCLEEVCWMFGGCLADEWMDGGCLVAVLVLVQWMFNERLVQVSKNYLWIFGGWLVDVWWVLVWCLDDV